MRARSQPYYGELSTFTSVARIDVESLRVTRNSAPSEAEIVELTDFKNVYPVGTARIELVVPLPF